MSTRIWGTLSWSSESLLLRLPLHLRTLRPFFLGPNSNLQAARINIRDQMSDLKGDAVDARPMDQLLTHSITYRIEVEEVAALNDPLEPQAAELEAAHRHSRATQIRFGCAWLPSVNIHARSRQSVTAATEGIQ